MTADRRPRRNILVAVAILIALAALLLTTCLPRNVPAPAPAASTAPSSLTASEAESQPPSSQTDEQLTPATLNVPNQIIAGATFPITWTGPDNHGDFITIVPAGSPSAEHGGYAETKQGGALELTAPIKPGPYEVRYVTGRSRSLLGQASVEVVSASATLAAPDEVAIGASFAVTWAGPNNAGDYVTVVLKGVPDDHFGSYAETSTGPTLTLNAPTDSGDAEVRYVAGQGRTVLARRPIRVVPVEVMLSAADEAIAGSMLEVTWSGRGNAGDYITVVPKQTPDGQYGNYADVSRGSPLNLLLPIMQGDAELRYMTGQGRRVLGRRPITIVAAEVTLSAPAQAAAATVIHVTWTGPNNAGDYITVVPKDAPDGRYGPYTLTSAGSPLSIKLPTEAGEAEVRYMTGQGHKVLARAAITIVR